jgi:hypothetical protein
MNSAYAAAASSQHYYSPAKYYSGQRVENISLFRIGRFETKSSHTYNLSCYKRSKKIYYFGT